MPSNFQINVGNIPDGDYKTILTNPADDSIVFASDINYISGVSFAGPLSLDNLASVTGFVIDNNLTPVNGAVISGFTSEIRVMINLESTAGAYYGLSENWVATRDYSIEQEVLFKGDLIRLHGNIGNLYNRAFIRSDGSILWFADGVGASIESATSVAPVNKLSIIKVERVGSTGKIYVNGTLVFTATVPTGTATVNTNGNQNGAISGGLLSNPKLTDLSTPANSLNFGLDELTQNFELAEQNVFGAEIFNDSGSFNNGSSGNVGSDFVNLTTTISYGVYVVTASETNQMYELSFTLSNASGANGVINSSNTAGQNNGDISGLTFSNGTHKLLLTQNGLTKIQFRLKDPASNVLFSNITLKSVTNALTYNNIAQTQDVRDTYNLIDSAFIGGELVTNGDFATNLDGWATAGNVTWSNGALVCDNSAGSTLFAARQDLDMTLGGLYKVQFTLLETTGNASTYLEYDAGGLFYKNAAGSYSNVMTNSSTLKVALRVTTGTTVTYDNISVKRIIDVAEQS